MRQSTLTTALGCLLIALAGTGPVTSASADAISDCRQDASENGIPAEELAAYIDDCLSSRDEPIVNESTDVNNSTDMDYIPPVEIDQQDEPPTGDTGVDR